MITRLENLHAKKFVHRDIKPDNIVCGSNKKQGTFYLIDFGFAKRYIDPRTGKHITCKEGKGSIGTPRFMSRRQQMGYEASRRDDLEGLGIICCYFLRNGRLPWDLAKPKLHEIDTNHYEAQKMIDQNTKVIEKYKKRVAKVKIETSIETLCEDLPEQFLVYMEYVRNLKFDEKPDYSSLRKLFKDLFIEKGFKDDGMFQWNTHKKKALQNFEASKDKNFKKSFAGGLGMKSLNVFAKLKNLITDKIIKKDIEMDKPVLNIPRRQNSSPRKTFLGEVIDEIPTEKDIIEMKKKERNSEIKEKMQKIVNQEEQKHLKFIEEQLEKRQELIDKRESEKFAKEMMLMRMRNQQQKEKDDQKKFAELTKKEKEEKDVDTDELSDSDEETKKKQKGNQNDDLLTQPEYGTLNKKKSQLKIKFEDLDNQEQEMDAIHEQVQKRGILSVALGAGMDGLTFKTPAENATPNVHSSIVTSKVTSQAELLDLPEVSIDDCDVRLGTLGKSKDFDQEEEYADDRTREATNLTVQRVGISMLSTQSASYQKPDKEAKPTKKGIQR